MEDYYRALKVASTAPPDEIKKAIRREMRVWSNRTNAPQIERRQEAERMVKLLEEAEAVLLDPASRLEYDRALTTAPAEQPQVSHAQPAAAQGSAAEQDMVQEGWRLLISGNIPDALYMATRATQRDASNPEAWVLLGQARFRWGEIEDALHAYKQAIILRPNAASFYFDLGSIYESAEMWPEAMQQFQRAAQIDPASTMYRAAIGVMCIRFNKYQDAIAILERCVAEEPANGSYQQFLAAVYADSAYEHWTFVPAGTRMNIPEGYYATNKRQVDQAMACIQRAQSFHVQTTEVANAISATSAHIHSMLKRKFYGNIFAVGGAAMIGILLLLLIQNIALGLYFLACAGLYVAASFTPQYLINRKVLAGVYPGQWFGSMMAGEGVAMALVGLFIILLLLPLMIIQGFLKNYILA